MQATLDNTMLFPQILFSLPESVYCKNLDGVYLACSQQMAKLAGCQHPDEIIGKTDYDLIWHSHAEEFLANDKIVMESGQSHVFQERGYTTFDELVIIRTIKAPFYDYQKQLIGVVGISFDVTDIVYDPKNLIQKAAVGEAMQRAESSYLKEWYKELSGQDITQSLSLDEIGDKLKTYMEGIIDKLPANIYWMDLNGRVLGCNQQMANVVGCQSRQELIGRNTHEYYEELNALACEDNNIEALKKGGVVVFEETGIFNGEEKVFLSHKSALRDKDGEPISLVGVSFDITERKHMERELKIAKEEAEAANLAKIHFMNNMRHDLRTPLSCVVGSARVLKAIETDPEKSEFIDGILKSSQHLLQMLTNMLEFDHIQSKEKTVEFKPVNIAKLSKDLIEMLQLTAKEKNLKLTLEISSGTPEAISSDVYRLQRVLMNLLNNAIKFTQKGFVKLRLERQNDSLQLIVQDTGIGIDSKRKHEVFEKFVRLVDSDKGLYEGEGLGLAIVKQFVDELQGAIFLDSELGKGCTFTIILPV